MNDMTACRCCGCYTIGSKGDFSYEICDVCFWEADPVQAKEPDYAGGANRVSLNEARKSYGSHGVSDLQFLKNIRKPTLDELPENN